MTADADRLVETFGAEAQGAICEAAADLRSMQWDAPKALALARRIARHAGILERCILDRQENPSPSKAKRPPTRRQDRRPR